MTPSSQPQSDPQHIRTLEEGGSASGQTKATAVPNSAAPLLATAQGPDFSNAVRLSLREWLLVGLFAVAMVLFAPAAWQCAEQPPLEPDERMPYDLSSDYWLYDRYVRTAAERYPTVCVGDSVVWGQYVRRGQTLSHYLNELAGAERFANLGLDGAHPMALAGLLEHYGKGIAGKNVLVQCNLLWLSSPRHDLQVTEEFQFNHPRLVPQFVPRLPCYKEEISPRIGIAIEQRVPFCSWANHLQQAYFDRMAVPAWTLEHPTENPLTPLVHGLPPADDVLHHEPISWTKRGIKPQDFAWVDPETSLQRAAFERGLRILRNRGNRVLVLLGPFNEHLLTPKNRPRYAELRQAMLAWLQAQEVAVIAPAALPSAEYADASHPLSAGYARLAKELWTDPVFQSFGGAAEPAAERPR